MGKADGVTVVDLEDGLRLPAQIIFLEGLGDLGDTATHLRGVREYKL
jgi:hypothetical protein